MVGSSSTSAMRRAMGAIMHFFATFLRHIAAIGPRRRGHRAFASVFGRDSERGARGERILHRRRGRPLGRVTKPFAGSGGPTRMKGNARPSLFDTTAAFDDPLEMLLACHRRIEKQLQTLERLRVHLHAHGVDADASSAAQALLRYFTRAAVDHP